MKKFLLIGMTLFAMTALIFVGCQRKSAGEGAAAPAPEVSVSVNEDGTVNNPEDVAVDPNKLVFWSLFSGGDGAWMDRIISDYNATGPARQVQPVMLVWADYYTKFGTAVAARRGPDIGVSHISRLPELVEQGMVIAVDDYATKAGITWSDFAPAMVEGITFDGKKYAIPLDTHAEIMYVNLDKLNAAGVTLAGDHLSVANAAEFKAVLDKIKPTLQSGETVISLPQEGDDPYRAWWATYFQMGGTPLVNDDGTAVTLDQGIAVRAADYIRSLYTDGYVLPGIADHQRFFQDGHAALAFGGTWATGVFSEARGLNFSAQPYPRLYGTNDACWADAHVFTIPAKQARSSADTQAAVDFTFWAASKGGATWAQSGQIPSHVPVQSSAAFTALPYRSGYARAASTAVLPSKNVNFGAIKDTLIQNLNGVWQGQTASQAAVENILSEMNAIIRR
ncbi:MAG: extracellular solute-binding protein [Spirochaetaceae bacterium]|jgi:multiple sugar transport system substrate-binding protein|nr:extracellular solute-binding protein [Spirochaetaceae bacterium]